MGSLENMSFIDERKLIKHVNLEEVLMNMAEGCYYLNSKMEFVFINKAAETLIEKPKEELLGVCLWDVLPNYIGSDVYKYYNRAYEEQKIQNFEYITLYSKKTVAIKVIPDKNGILSIFSDITEKKKREEEQMYFEKLKIIGEMAAGVAHEVRNPITTVKGFLQVIAQNDELDEYKDMFTLMIEEMNRVNNIISEFLDIAKHKPNKMAFYNLNEIIKTMFPLLKTRALKEGKCIDLDLIDIPDLKIDQYEIRQLLLNMVNNALDAMDSNGTVTIKTCIEDDMVILSIKDSGKGIPANIVERISTPFVTSKENGTGLGLAICYAIAKRNSATVDFHTNTSGTIFNIRFNT